MGTHARNPIRGRRPGGSGAAQSTASLQLGRLGVGRHHAHKNVLILIDEHQATVTDHTTGEILGTYNIEPNKNYWRNQTKKPGRWPGSETKQ